MHTHTKTHMETREGCCDMLETSLTGNRHVTGQGDLQLCVSVCVGNVIELYH